MSNIEFLRSARDAFDVDLRGTRGLSLSIHGGPIRNTAGAVLDVPFYRVELTNNATNYVERTIDGDLQVSTSGFSPDGAVPLWIAWTENSEIVRMQDMRGSSDGGV